MLKNFRNIILLRPGEQVFILNIRDGNLFPICDEPYFRARDVGFFQRLNNFCAVLRFHRQQQCAGCNGIQRI